MVRDYRRHKESDRGWEGNEFFKDCWAGERDLKSLFPRLYYLRDNKKGRVREMGEWREGRWEWGWKWRRPLFEREEVLLNNLFVVVNRFPLSQDKVDQWKWGDQNELYTVTKAYAWMENQVNREVEKIEEFHIIWNKLIPSKIQLHAWRVLQGRIPTTVNLRKRDAISNQVNAHCVFCKNHEETVGHVLYECNFSYSLWMKCVEWMGVKTVLPSDPASSLLLFSKLLKGKVGKNLAICIWECVIWILWKARNAVIFRNEIVNWDELVEELKARIWSWFGARGDRPVSSSFTDWVASVSNLQNLG